ncbi:hypothetical protein Gotur_001062 [Gossypium turneri]
MARGIPNYDDGGSFYDHTGGGGGSGGQYFTQSSSLSTSSSSDSLYHSSINRGTIGDVFFGTDDIRDTRDLLYKEDVLESYQKETAQKYLRQRSKKRSISNFGFSFSIVFATENAIFDYGVLEQQYTGNALVMEKDVEGGSHRGVRRVASRATKNDYMLVASMCFGPSIKLIEGFRRFFILEMDHDYGRDYVRFGMRFEMELLGFWAMGVLLTFGEMFGSMEVGPLRLIFSFLLPTQCLVKIAPIRPPCGEEIMDWPGWKWDEGEFSLQNQHMQPWIKCGKVLTNVERVKRHLTMDSSFHICGTNVEDIDNVLRRCSMTILCWNSLVNNDKLAEFYNLSIEDWIVRNLTRSDFIFKSIETDLGIYKCPKKVDVTFMVSAIDGEKESKCRRWPELGIHNRNGRRRDPRGIISEELKRFRTEDRLASLLKNRLSDASKGKGCLGESERFFGFGFVFVFGFRKYL